MKCEDCKQRDAQYAVRRLEVKPAYYLFLCADCLFNYARAELDELERLQ